MQRTRFHELVAETVRRKLMKTERSGPPELVTEREARNDDEHDAFTDLLDGAEDVTTHPPERGAGDDRDNGSTDGDADREWADPPAGRQSAKGDCSEHTDCSASRRQ